MVQAAAQVEGGRVGCKIVVFSVNWFVSPSNKRIALLCVCEPQTGHDAADGKRSVCPCTGLWIIQFRSVKRSLFYIAHTHRELPRHRLRYMFMVSDGARFGRYNTRHLSVRKYGKPHTCVRA